MKNLNTLELCSLKDFRRICNIELVVEYDERDPFKALEDYERGRTHERYRRKREAELGQLKVDIRGNFKSAKKPKHKYAVRSYMYPMIWSSHKKRGRPPKEIQPLQQLWPPVSDHASSISSCGF